MVAPKKGIHTLLKKEDREVNEHIWEQRWLERSLSSTDGSIQDF